MRFKVKNSKKNDYIKALMEQNAKNKNISLEQHEFLEQLAHFRHKLHSSPHKYFLNRQLTYEFDYFFASVQSETFFKERNLPYPKDILNMVKNVQNCKNEQIIDFNKAVEQFAYQSEALNTLIERYLRNIDDEKGTLYCPSGMTRDTKEDPIELTKAKILRSKRTVSPYIERIEKKIDKKLDKINSISDKKLINELNR